MDMDTIKVLQNSHQGGTEQILWRIFLIPSLYILEKKKSSLTNIINTSALYGKWGTSAKTY